jgi:polar amino acid transport system substrate-binding protein
VDERLKEAGISSQAIQQTPVVATATEGSLAFSRNIADDIIQKWQNALDQLKQSGRYDQLMQEYLVVN